MKCTQSLAGMGHDTILWGFPGKKITISVTTTKKWQGAE